ncbi:phage tail length tape measure family protein [Methylorubrum sp. SB2]|uniref:phage tail length tape measure family protein n=1 Tax=Methylorubrum subtropicum TaxID=3138812 RepID=UPI00313BF8AA
MVAVNEIRDEYRLEAKTEGVEQAKAAAEGLASATDKITIASEKQERKVISVQRALEKFAAANDQAFRAQQQVERAQALVNRAFEQGLSESLAYQRATVVLADKQAALARITAQSAAANDNNAASMARMRAQYDPIFAAQLKHRTALEGIAEAEKAGAITATTAMQARIAATRAMEDQTQKLERLAQTQKAAAQRQVNQQLIVPDRGADIAAYAAEMDRLRAKFDPLFAAQTAYRSGLAELRQALATGAISEAAYTAELDRRKAAFAEQVRGLGLVSAAERAAAAAAQETARATQAAANAAAAAAAKARAQGIVSGQTITADRGADVAAYGQQLDALRAKYNPLFAAGQAYKAQLLEIGQAARVGAITETERAAAITRTKETFVKQVDAIRSNSGAIAVNRQQWQSLGFQINDVFTSLSSGASPLMVLTQQGGQIYQALDGPRGVTASLKEVGNFLTGLLTPMRLVIGGFAAMGVAGLAAAISFANAQRDIRLALLGIGQTAGLSAEQVDLISRQAADAAKISVAAAREIEAAFLKSGKVTGDVFLEATVAAANFAKATKQDNGQAADFLAQNLGSLSAGGYEALARQAANFDAGLERQVRSLLEAGREADAQRLVLERFGQAYEKVGQQLTLTDRALGVVKRGWDGLWDSLGRATSGASRSSAELLTVTETQIKNREALAKATNSDPASDQQYGVLRERAARLRAEIERTGEAVRTTSENARNSLKSLDKAAVNAAVPEIASLTQVRENLAKANAELNGLEAGGGSAERIDAAKKAVAALSAAERDYQVAGGAANMERAKANELLRAGLQGLQAVTPEQKAEAARQQALAETFGTVTTGQERSARAASAYSRAMAEQRAASDASSRAMTESTRTTNEVARATAQTGKSIEYLTASRKVDEQIRAGVFREDEREGKIKEQLRSQLEQINLQAAQRKRTLEDQASAQESANASVAAGTLASAQASRQVQNEIELRTLARERDAASGEAKTELARRYDELAAAQQRQMGAEDVQKVQALIEDEKRRIELLEREAALVGQTTRERQVELAVLQAKQGLDRQGINSTSGLSREYLDLTRVRADREAARAEFERLAQDVSSVVSGTFDDMFKAGNKGLAGFFDSFARGFARIGTRILEQNLIAPLVTSAMGGGSGAAGTGANLFGGFDFSKIEKAVSEGSFSGIMESFGDLLKPGADSKGGGFASSKLGGGLLSAGVGASIGYQSQSPLVGALGGAASGFAMGGPVGGVVGGIAGLLGGLFGKDQAKKAAAKKLKEQLEAYKEAYRQAEPEIRKLEATFRGESVGNVGGQIDAAFQQAVQANKTASQAGDQTRANAIMVDFTKYAFRLRDVFMNAFEGTLSEVAAGFGTSGPFAQANAAVATLGESLKAFVKDAESLPQAEANSARARAAAQQAALAALDPPKALSDTQSRLAAIQGTAAGLSRVLQDLGMSADEAAAAIRDRTAKAMDALRAQFSADLGAKINDAAGKSYLNDIADLVKERDGLLADARAIGADTAQVGRYFTLAAQKIVDGSELTGAAFADLVKRFPALKGAVVEFGQAIDTTAAKAEAAARAVGYQDRSFAAGNDTSTLAGALAAQDRKAAQDRAAEAKAGGRAMADLEKALAAERTAIIKDFAARAAEAEASAREAGARRVLSAEDRLFAARNEASTLSGKLAEMDRQHAQERLDEVAAGGQAMAALEAAQAAERLKIVREAGAAEAAARKQALAEAQTFLDGATKNIRTYLDGLKTGQDTALSPGDRLAEAQKQFDAQLARAKSGDRDAMGSITTYASTLLDAGRANFASSQGYQDILAAVQQSLGDLPKQVSAEQFIVDAINKSTTDLGKAIAANNPVAIAAALDANFSRLDTNLDGKLSAAEFVAGLGPLATAAEQEKARAIFDRIDQNGDGLIDAQEKARFDLVSAIEANRPELIQRALSSEFDKLDTDSSGGLTESEFLKGVGPLATAAEQAAARAYFKAIDENGDGLLSATEMMRGQLKTAIEINSPTAIATALNKNFDTLDTTMNGRLTKAELLAGLGPLATAQQQAEALKVFNAIDRDGDGQISKLEAVLAELKTNLGSPTAIATALNDNFKMLDKTSDKALDLAEFTAAIGPLATKADQQAAKAVFDSIDRDGDGLISKMELTRSDLETAIKANSASAIATALNANFDTLADKTSGGITKAQFDLSIAGLATKAEQAAAYKVFQAIDADGNGIITKTEAVRAELLGQLKLNDPAKIASALNANFSTLTDATNGRLTSAQLLAGLGPLATKADQAAALAVFRNIDADGNGIITKLEAVRGSIVGAVQANNAKAFATEIDKSFTDLDTRVDGLLDKAELANAIKGLSTDAQVQRANAWLKAIDTDGDGMLSKTELIRARMEDVKGNTGATKTAVDQTKTTVGAGNTLAADMKAFLKTINDYTGLSKKTLDAIGGYSRQQKELLGAISNFQKTSDKNLALAAASLDTLKLSSATQEGTLKALQGQFSLLNPININGFKLQNNMVEALNKIVFNTANTVIGLKSGASYTYATGGWVNGPGTGTSDSISARLSNGEFVVNAASARMNAGLLEAMNDNRTLTVPAMPVPVPVAVGGGGDVVGELRALRAEVARLRSENKAGQEMQARVTLAGANKVAAATEGVREEAAEHRSDDNRRERKVAGVAGGRG